MTDQPGLRERKKLRTRRAILDAAIRLFQQKGYERTTVSEIAEAADVATKTFFNYFPTKEDLLFSDQQHRHDLTLDVVAHRGEDESLADLLDRLCERLVVIASSESADWSPELVPFRMRLISEVPALQARALKLMFDIEREVADALQKAYGDRLDPVAAAAVIGCIVGAAQATALASIRMGEPPELRRASTIRGLEIAMRGVRSVSDEVG